MTRQALLLATILIARPGNLHAAPATGDAEQAGGLFGMAVSAAMDAQRTVAMMNHRQNGSEPSWGHRPVQRQRSSNVECQPRLDGVTFSPDIAAAAAHPVATTTSAVTPQALAAALSDR